MTAPPPLTWAPRTEPLTVAAVTAVPGDVGALVAATTERVGAGASLRVAAGDGCVVLGAADDLPWCPGAVYLGWESGVLVPTTRRPVPAVDLFGSALRSRLPTECDLVVLVPWGVLATRAPARAVDVAGLTALAAAVPSVAR